jgi:hypothetical protein
MKEIGVEGTATDCPVKVPGIKSPAEVARAATFGRGLFGRRGWEKVLEKFARFHG